MVASRWKPAAWTSENSLQSWRMSMTFTVLPSGATLCSKMSGTDLIQIKAALPAGIIGLL